MRQDLGGIGRHIIVVVGVSVVALSACSDADTQVASTTATSEATTSTTAAAASTLVPTTTTVVPTTTTRETTTTGGEPVLSAAIAVGLAERGGYGVGKRLYTFVDSSRDDRAVDVSVYYPALADGALVVEDAEPDLSAAPYPVVVGSDQIANIMGAHLASHGFVFVGGMYQGTWGRHPDPKMVDYPLDLMAALDGLESLDGGDPLAGAAATDRSGVVDYSFGSWTALMLAGGRVDPGYYEASCSSPPSEWTDFWFDYVCGSPAGWDAMVQRGIEAGVAVRDDLWLPMGDGRIKAAMPMGPEGFDLTGPVGLADIAVPVMLVAAGSDTINPYELAAVPLYDTIDDDLVSMITFTDAGHMMIFEPDAQVQFQRFAAAFFGYHLAGIDEYAPALTTEFVEGQAPYLEPHPSYETLVWGIDR